MKLRRIRTTSKGYKWDSLSFLPSLLLMIALGFFIASQYNYDFTPRATLTCYEYTCFNSWYYVFHPDQCSFNTGIECSQLPPAEDFICEGEWCNMPQVPQGTYGQEKTFLFKYYLHISILLYLLALPLNHYTHNKGKKLHFGFVEFWEKELEPVTKFLNKLEKEE